MSVRWIRSIRAALTEPRALLGSWKLSVVLMLAATVFYLLLAIYSWSVPSHVVSSIAGLSVYWACWVLVLVNTTVCIWNRWRGVAWHSVLFHGSFLLVFGGALLSLGAREESRLWVATGERFSGDGSQYLARGGTAAPDPFTLRSIHPEFWRDQLLFTRLEAVLEFEGGTKTTRINKPLWLKAASFLRLSGFGFAPRYELLDAQGRVLESAFVKLNVFPPGQRDFLIPDAAPYRVYLEIYPDAEITPAGIVNRTQDLREPVLLASVYRGHLAVAAKALRLGQPLAFEGVTLRFPEIALWGELTWVRDPGVLLVLGGAALGLAGLVGKLWTRY